MSTCQDAQEMGGKRATDLCPSAGEEALQMNPHWRDVMHNDGIKRNFSITFLRRRTTLRDEP